MSRFVPGKTLRRCDVCGKFHASYRVETEAGPQKLCYSCWKSLTSQQPPPPTQPEIKQEKDEKISPPFVD